MHRLLSLDLNRCGSSDMETIISSYFNPSSFNHIKDQVRKRFVSILVFGPGSRPEHVVNFHFRTKGQG